MVETGETALFVKMFGFFDITYKGKSIFLESASNARPLALLRFLLSQKDKVFVPETIAENVWPENEYLDEKKVIRTYIHRLRKIIAQENVFKKDFSEQINILNVKGNYKLVLSDDVRMDTLEFEQCRNVISRELDDERLIETFNRVFSIYSGEFLEDSKFDHWVIMLRNYYLRSFCAMVGVILEHLERRQRFSDMIDICERSLQIYDLDEAINIFFIKAMIETNQVNNAMKHYSFITSKMYNTLSVTPSEKMREVYKRLKSTQVTENTAAAPVVELESIDSSNLWLMINEAVRSQMKSTENHYSVGYVTIDESDLVAPDEPADGGEASKSSYTSEEIQESLRQALEFALRKNDMYAIADDTTAILVLHDAKPDFYANISGRISTSFYSRINKMKYKLNVRFCTAVCID